MLSAFTTALPPSSLLPGGSVPLVVVDAQLAWLGVTIALATLAALVVARRGSSRTDARATMHAVDRSTDRPARNLSAA
jgi:hypothetical protein